jgi:hypothetical protein
MQAGCYDTPITFRLGGSHDHSHNLAIDLGKYNSVSCHYEPETKATTFRTIRTTPDEMRKLLARPPVKLVVIEACSVSG